MSEPAYDIKPDLPFRTQLDPITVSQVLYAGARMLELESPPDAEPPTINAVIWRLIQEAVECDRAIRRPAPKPKTKSGPDVCYTRSEIWAVELQWAADNIVYPPRFIRDLPSAAAHQRYLEVMTWFRFITTKSKQKRAFIKMLMALASGMPPSRAADAFPSLHYRNGDAVWAAKYRAIRQIAERLKSAVKDFGLLE